MALKDPDARREYQRQWRAKNKDRINAAHREYQKKWRKDNPERARAIAKKSFIQNTYGITVEYVETLEAAQDGRCAICERPAKLHIDHCHDKGTVRGLLCATCNTGIGLLRHNEQTLSNAIAYLRRTA